MEVFSPVETSLMLWTTSLLDAPSGQDRNCSVPWRAGQVTGASESGTQGDVCLSSNAPPLPKPQGQSR